MKVAVNDILDGKFHVKRKIDFTHFGGINLDKLKNEMNIKEVAEKKTHSKTVINDIQIFPDDTVNDVKRKINSILNIHPSYQLLWDKEIIGFEYIIDGIEFEFTPDELLNPEDNTLYRYRFYELIDKKPHWNKLINILDIRDFIKTVYIDDVEYWYYYILKYWPKLSQEEFSDLVNGNSMIYKNEYDIFVKEKEYYNKLIDVPLNFIVTSATYKVYHKTQSIEKKFNDMALTQPNIFYSCLGNLCKEIKTYKTKRNLHEGALNLFYKYGSSHIFVSINNKYIIILVDKNTTDISQININVSHILKNLGVKEVPMLISSKLIYSYVTLQMDNLIQNYEDLKKYNILSKIPSMELINMHDYIKFEVTMVENSMLRKIINFIITNNVEEEVRLTIGNKIKRLSNRDPVLYPKGFNWASTCQKKKQPIIYNSKEYEHLSDKVKKKTVKYWNYTTNTDAYYYCDDKKFSNLSFIDLRPCCGIRSFEAWNEQKQREYKYILEHHALPVEKISSNVRYIPQYGKFLGNNRVMYLPVFFEKLFKKKGIHDKYYLYTKQNIDFDNVIWIDDHGKFLLRNTPYYPRDMMIVIVFEERNYILCKVDIKEFYKTNEIEQYIFDFNSDIVQLFIEMKNLHDPIFQFKKKLGKWEIKKYFAKELVEYILLKKDKDYILYPIFSPLIQLNKNVRYDEINTNINLPYDKLKSFIRRYRSPIEEIALVYKNKQIGFKTDDYIYFHNPTNIKSEKRIILRYDINKVFHSINSPPMNISKILEKKNKNKIIIKKIREELFKTENVKMRKKIKDLITDNINESLFKIKQIVNNSDYQIIKEKILKGKPVFDDDYDFDGSNKKIKVKDKTLQKYLDCVLSNPLLKRKFQIQKIVSDVKLHPGEKLVKI